MSKQEQLRERILEKLQLTTKQFRNDYIGEVVKWEEDRVLREIKFFEENYLNKSAVEINKALNKGIYRAESERHAYQLINKYSKNVLIRDERMNIAKMEAMVEANISFDNKLERLAYKLSTKGYKVPVIKSTYINQNFECVITDRENKDLVMYARTIIASGLVQRPHYRYIITHQSGMIKKAQKSADEKVNALELVKSILKDFPQTTGKQMAEQIGKSLPYTRQLIAKAKKL